MNYRLKIQYEGTRYRGWQRQPGTDMTIQGKIEQVLSRLFEQPVEVQGAGRTDAGVHAWEQVAHFRVGSETMSSALIEEYLNQYLPEDIRVLAVEKAGERFHSRLNAVGKRYCYHLMKWNRENVFLRRYSWKLERPFDVARARLAADELVGKHDFRSFCSKPSKKKSTVRTLRSIEIQEKEDEIQITYEGNGFLYNMVRILTGTLVEVGTGERDPGQMREILETGRRESAGVTAPAQGVFLEKVYYE